MNKKSLIVMPIAVCAMGLTSCNKSQINSLTANCRKPFYVQDTITKNDVGVIAEFKDLTYKAISDWTCDAFVNGSYTFTAADEGTKEFNIKYNDKTTTLKVNVGKEGDEAKLNFNGTVYEFNESGAISEGKRLKAKATIDSNNGIKFIQFTNSDHFTIGYCDATKDINILSIYKDGTKLEKESGPNGFKLNEDTKIIELATTFETTRKDLLINLSINKHGGLNGLTITAYKNS